MRSQVLVLAALLLTGMRAQSQATFGTQPVGVASGEQNVTVTAKIAGTVSTVEVLTLGGTGLDFEKGIGVLCGPVTLAVDGTCAQSVTFKPVAPALRLGAVVLRDSAGNVLGTTYLSGTGSGGLGVLFPGNVLPVAGNGQWVQVDDGKLATQAELNLPASVAVDGAGNLYIADSLHDRIRKVTASTGIISTVAGNGNPAYTGDSGLATAATLNSPGGVALDGAGNVYIADTKNNAVRKIATATGIITTVAGTGAQGSSGDGAAATVAKLNQPWGVTLDGGGNLFIADTANHRIRRVDALTGIITTVVGTGETNPDGSGDFEGDDGLATLAELNRPFAVAFDTAGNMYIPDSANNRIRIVNLAGIITTFAGIGTVGFSGDGATAKQAQLWSPSGVAVDPAGNVYIADTQNNTIRKVSSATGFITSIARNGTGTYFFNGAFYKLALYGPIGISFDGSGNLFVADYFDMVVREIQSNFVALDYTLTPVRQGDKSAPQSQTVENDGNAALDLTAFTPDQNAALDAASTTCNTGSPFLAVDADCTIGAEFAPSPAVTPTNPETGNIDIGKLGDTVNSPLDIQLIGYATAVNSTTVSVSSNLNPSGFGQTVTFTATVTTGAAAGNLTGTLTFFDGATPMGAALPLIPPGTTVTVSYATPALTVGLHTITASYSGDPLHFPSRSTDNSTPALVQTVLEKTATNLSTNLNPSAVGQNVTFTATVTVSDGGGINPDGSITFFDGGTILGNVPLNASGVATFSTATLTNGIHPISATYGGDAAKQILGSDSAVLNQDVQAPASTVVTSSLNPSSYGALVAFTATVSSSGTVPATGVVNFLDGAQQIGTANLVGATGVATFTTYSLAAGQHFITAVYLGDSNNSPCTSAALIQTVNKVTPIITWATPAAIPYGTALSVSQLNATAGGIPGIFAYTPGAGAVLPAGVQTLSVTFTPTDTADYNIVVSTVTLNVTKTAPTLAVSSSGSPSSYGGAVTFTATISSGPTGTVTFYDAGSPIGTGTLNGATAAFATSTLAVGTHTITASWAGNSNYDAVTSSAITQMVIKANPAITWPTPAAITYGTALSAAQLDASTPTAGTLVYTPAAGTVLNAGLQTLSVTFTPTDATDYNAVTATVSLTVTKATPTITWITPAAISYGTPLSATQLNASSGGAAGTFVYTPAAGTVLGAGIQTLAVTFTPVDAGDLSTATATVLLTVTKATPTLTVNTSGTPTSYGSPVTFTATVSSGPTGTVTFNDAGSSIGTGTLNGTSATLITSSLPVGTHVITAFWPGNSNYNSVTSSSITQVVNQTQTTTTVTAVPNPGIAGAPVAITATVKVIAGSAATTGIVTFTDGTTTLGTAALGSAGTATINPILAPGVHSIVATYAGDVNDSGSASAPLSLTVQLATTSATVASNLNPALVLVPVTFTAKVTGNGGVPTGSVAFLSEGVSFGAANLDATGTATVTFSALAAGSHSITASYAGDANDSPSTSAAITQVVGTISTATALGVSSTTGVNPRVILVATVIGASGPVPTGTVTFKNGTTVIGSSSLDSGGIATLTPDLALGNYSIVAVYSGDALHSPSTSQPVAISGAPAGFNLAVTPASVTMAVKQNATVNVTLVSIDGFADTIGLGCSSLPASVTCHFSNFSAKLAANATQTAQLVIDTNSPLTGGSSAMNSKSGHRDAYLAGLFLPLGAFFGWIFWRFRKRNMAVFATALILLFSGAAMLATGCGGISTTNAKPGTYVIQVTGTGANSNLIHYQNVTLTITN